MYRNKCCGLSKIYFNEFLVDFWVELKFYRVAAVGMLRENNHHPKAETISE